MTGSIQVTPEELDVLGGTCETQAQAVADVINAVDRGIAGTQWESDAARKFKGDWSEKFKGQLQELSTNLQMLGGNAKTMAGNYREADASYKGG